MLITPYTQTHALKRFKVSVSDQLSDKGLKNEYHNVTIEDDWRYRCKWVRIFIFLSLIRLYLYNWAKRLDNEKQLRRGITVVVCIRIFSKIFFFKKMTSLGVFEVADHESDICFSIWDICTKIYQKNINFYKYQFFAKIQWLALAPLISPPIIAFLAERNRPQCVQRKPW